MRPYADLQFQLYLQKLNHGEVASTIGISKCALSKKLNKKSHWTDKEMCVLMDIINQPRDLIPKFFEML